jgi:predicted N-acyltransferase
LVGRSITNFSQQSTVPISSALGRRVVQAVLSRYPLLICQAPFGSTTGLLLPRGDERRAFGVLRNALAEASRRRNTSFTILGWLNAQERQIIEPASGFRFIKMDSATSLHIEWPTFDAYVASRGKSMRKDLNRHNNRAADLNITVERARSYAQHGRRIFALVDNVMEHHRSYGTNIYPDDVLASFEREMPDNSVMLLARRNDEIVGCGLLVHDQGVMGLAMLGLDYNHQYVYFQLFYEAIRYAIENGIKVIRGGSGAYDFKRRLGFRDEPTYVGFSAQQVVFRWLADRLTQVMVTAEQPQMTAEAG